MKKVAKKAHPMGERKKTLLSTKNEGLLLDTYGGQLQIDWDANASLTPLGQMPFFIEFLKAGGLFDSWVSDCPIDYTSPNAPTNREICGTLLLAILSGYTRYSHISRLRSDTVNPGLLGMGKILSEDAIRRGLASMDEQSGLDWIQSHLLFCYQPLLTESWILDTDTTVKPLYGEQEGAVRGYNPQKPGRPSHVYHSYMIANLRLMLSVDVSPGNQNSSSQTTGSIWDWLEKLPRAQWPEFIRGDCHFGTNNVMAKAEEKELPYLFKLKCTSNVKRLIERLTNKEDWGYAGQGWEGIESQLQLQGWEKSRRVIVLRRRLKKEVAVSIPNQKTGQMEFTFADMNHKMQVYEYAVLVTSLTDEVLTIAQHYRDRADSENIFDELKNQWGWCGFTTHDLKRCRLIARIIALVYNWWTLFVRLANPHKHTEAITSRPLMLYGVGRLTQHARQKRMTVSSTHKDANYIQSCFMEINQFFKRLKQNAEQLSPFQRWAIILSYAMKNFLKGRILKPPGILLNST